MTGQRSNANQDRTAKPEPTDAVIRRPVRVVPLDDDPEPVFHTDVLKGSRRAAGVADLRMWEEPQPEILRKDPGEPPFHVIAAKGAGDLRTPTFSAGDGRETAVALFTSRDDARHYLHAAGWDQTAEVQVLRPDTLAEWLRRAKAGGVTYLAINPDPMQLKEADPHQTLVLALADVPEDKDDVATWLLRQIALAG